MSASEVAVVGEPESTRARAAESPGAESVASRARDRPGRVTGQERSRLRGAFGYELWRRRCGRGWTQVELAERAGVSVRSVRDLECGQVRPSDSMTRKLAVALEDGRDAVTVAMCDLELQAKAGASLRRWRRRRPPRSATLKVYAAARERLEAERAERDHGLRAWNAAFDEAFTAALTDPPADPQPPPPSTAATLWPERWPRVRSGGGG